MKKHKIQNIREPENEYENQLVEDCQHFTRSALVTVLAPIITGLGTALLGTGITHFELVPVVLGSITTLVTFGAAVRQLNNLYNLYNKRVEDVECFLDMPVGEEIEGAKVI